MHPWGSGTRSESLRGQREPEEECYSDDDRVEDAFAELQTNMQDTIDVREDVPATSQREFAVALYAQVQELEKLGMVIGTGRRDAKWGTTPITILYVVAMPTRLADAPPTAHLLEAIGPRRGCRLPILRAADSRAVASRRQRS
jgi:hypothetical protein